MKHHTNPARARMAAMLGDHRRKRAADAPRRREFAAHLIAGRLDEARRLMHPEEWASYEAHVDAARRKVERETAAVEHESKREQHARARADADRVAVALAEMERRARAGDPAAVAFLAARAEAEAAERQRAALEAQAARETWLEAEHAGVSTADLAAALGEVTP